jgi:hypothetical protein
MRNRLLPTIAILALATGLASQASAQEASASPQWAFNVAGTSDYVSGASARPRKILPSRPAST